MSNLARMKIILLITLFATIFWIGFEQKTGALTVFAEDRAGMRIGTLKIEAEWYQIINPALIIGLYVPFTWLMRRIDSRRAGGPVSPLVKQAWGTLFLGLGYLFLVIVDLGQSDRESVAIALGALYLFHTIGELCLEPIGQSLVSRLAPKGLESFSQALWDSASFLALLGAGFLPGWLAEFPGSRGFLNLWITLMTAALLGGLVLLWLTPRITPVILPLLRSNDTAIQASSVHAPTPEQTPP